mmetsp:Transcript_3499/g.4394  ORF Transcript_3499/g.4394 Transcript_3499/m.4394 type:complete len:162 (+) Transcript_3499:284-769(+)|eukprot:CAMPEP_0204823730 /NCGR_PEP_ID=MMETSP1346-20131115/1814_1 /ASSEMBLY_ACC=CAM_ASM_000771 /TAXON_ID=215587 /ORGANISM="Aplanochytrium stocchinoi, Strain GSBS06" /LENGTH=161 /DNA_ID=CAMNT_0051950511 /DNA_START=231 /DNA_END=716 /DNA_ORIENTATION=-
MKTMQRLIGRKKKGAAGAPEATEKNSKEYWANTFEQFDENKDGIIDHDELKKTLEKLTGKAPTERQLRKIFDKVDLNHNDKIEYKEFEKMMEERVSTQDSITESFKKFDKDGNGKISKEELMSALNMVEPTSEDEVNEIIDEMDEDGDGMVNYEEFTKFFI